MGGPGLHGSCQFGFGRHQREFHWRRQRSRFQLRDSAQCFRRSAKVLSLLTFAVRPSRSCRDRLSFARQLYVEIRTRRHFRDRLSDRLRRGKQRRRILLALRVPHLSDSCCSRDCTHCNHRDRYCCSDHSNRPLDKHY